MNGIADHEDGGIAGIRSIGANELASLRGEMLRFAHLQLRDISIAEDIVQEAIEGAVRSSSPFSGQASLKTWIFAILKNKIADRLRQQDRTVSISSLLGDEDNWEEGLECLFSESGRWRPEMRPRTWPDPEESMSNQQFWRVFEACLERLPANTARVFMMRELLGFDSDEICARLGLSMSNCHVILHRARLRLRTCLEESWEPPGAASC